MGMKSMGAPGSCRLVMPSERNILMVSFRPSFISSLVSGGSWAMRSRTGFSPSSLRFPRGSPVSGSRSMREGGSGSGVSLLMPASSSARLLTLIPSCPPWRVTEIGWSVDALSRSYLLGNLFSLSLDSLYPQPCIHLPGDIVSAFLRSSSMRASMDLTYLRSTVRTLLPPELKWAWLSTNPGVTSLPPRSMTLVCFPV